MVTINEIISYLSGTKTIVILSVKLLLKSCLHKLYDFVYTIKFYLLLNQIS
jgi:hypothetical protein